jgi:hypothetical protein
MVYLVIITLFFEIQIINFLLKKIFKTIEHLAMVLQQPLSF